MFQGAESALGLIDSVLNMSQDTTCLRHMRQFSQAFWDIENRGKFATETLVLSQARIVLDFPIYSNSKENRYYSDLEFFNRIGC